MSALLMGMVWGIELSHQEREVLLALADHARDEPNDPFLGTHIFPSVGRIAWKTDYSVRTVQYALRSLEAKNIITAVAHEKGGRGRATQYIMRLDNGTKKAPYVPSSSEKGAIYDTSDEERVQSTTNDEKGAIYDTKGCNLRHKRVQSTTQRVQPTAPQPSITINNHQENHHARTRETLDEKKENEPEPEADTLHRPMAFPAFAVAYCEQEGYTRAQVKTSKLMAAYTRYRASFDADVTTREEANSND